MDKTLQFIFFFFIVRKRYIQIMAYLNMNRFYYKPLPDNLKIGSSKIDGHGIFATINLDKGLDLGCTHIKIPIVHGFIRTQLGGFINHSEDNNCELFVKEDWDDYIIFNIKTIKNIDKNNEILLNYDL